MEKTHTQTGEAIDVEFTEDRQMVRSERPHALATADGGGAMISPGALREQIAAQKENYAIMRDYVKSEMAEGHHFGYMSRVNDPNAQIKAGEKPMLLQDGAFKILNLFRYFPGNVETKETREGSDFSVRATIPIFNGGGAVVATGDGMCSTREVKYAYRRSERLCPTCQQPAIMTDNKSPEGGFYCWAKKGGCGAKFKKGDKSIEEQVLGRIDNPDKADLENTVLKMAIKRATVAAVRKLPLVSDLFAPEGPSPADDTIHSEPKGSTSQTAPKSNRTSSSQKPAQSAAPSPAERDLPKDADAVQLRIDVNELLKVKFGGDVDAIAEYLNGRNPEVMLVSALEKMRDDLAAIDADQFYSNRRQK